MTPLLLAAAVATAAPAVTAPNAPVAVTAPAAAPFNRDAWAGDWSRLKVALANGYANLDWVVKRRDVSLQRLDQFMSGNIAKAQSDTEMLIALFRLVDRIDDPHLRLMPGKAPGSATLLPMQSHVATDLAPACNATPARMVRRASPLASAPGYAAVGTGPFAAGMIGRTGVVRVGSFDEGDYGLCLTDPDPRAQQLARRKALDAALGETMAALKARGMTRLVIDLTGNGGGSEWSSEMAARFSSATLKRTEPRRVGPTCDRAPIWTGAAAPCPVYGDVPHEETIRDTPYWTGPVAVMVDQDTASAAEEFAVWLRDNGRARLVGVRTLGAGCGYMDGGHAFQFTAVPAHLMMPNCSRFTKDGMNEIEGQRPDVDADWRDLTPAAMPALIDRMFARR